MTPPTMPPEIEAAIDKYERAAIANAGALGAPDEHAEHTATWLALTSAITSALVVAELRGRAAGREDALAQAPEIEAAIKALEADTFEHGKCPGTPRGLDLAAAREVKRNDLRAAIAADKARAVEGMRPVLSQADADALIGAYGTAVDKLAGFAEEPPANRDHYKAQLDELYTRHMAARAALLAALTGAGGGR